MWPVKTSESQTSYPVNATKVHGEEQSICMSNDQINYSTLCR